MLDSISVNLCLFTGPQCSLCDLALAIVDEFNRNVEGNSSLFNNEAQTKIELDAINIRESTDHYHLYATRIPVLKRTDNNCELGWPFTLDDLIEFIK